MNLLRVLRRYKRVEIGAVTGICISSIAVSVIVSIFLPYGIDWHGSFRPASIALLTGQSPYVVSTFYAAPWGLLPLLPLALLPENVGRGVLFTISILILAIVAYRLKANPFAASAFLLSPPVLHGLLNANIDWLAMLGFILPPQIGLLFVTVKPQIGIGLVVFWLVKSWREGRSGQVIRVFWPVVTVSLVSFFLFGLWPLRFQEIIDFSKEFNASFWPTSIPVGLTLLAASIRKKEPRYAIASSPCLSPHVVFHSYSGALAALLPTTIEMIVAVIGLWILVIMRSVTGT